MNKTAIKNFAIWARNKLRSEIAYKAGLLGISDKGIAEPLSQSTDDLQIFDIGTSQPVKLEGKTAIEQRRSLVAAIKAKRLPFAEAFDAVIEEVAYTWFNRLIAVRFMEVNDYLPSRMRVLSSDNSAKAEPDFVTSPFDTDIEFTDAEKDYIDELKDHSKSDELFQFMFIRQCNKLNEILPELFEKTNDYTELLLNVSFTDKDGIVYHLVHDIPEDDFDIEKEGQVEIIGWLYQYYNTEPKDKVFSRPSGQKIRKEDVPAATQLFTPDWIVRYMVENSLGRLWIENASASHTLGTSPSGEAAADPQEPKASPLGEVARSAGGVAEKMGWKYYLPEAEQTPEVAAQLHNNSTFNFPHSTFLDPCMGSGHILVYAFDVFMQIYTSQGYTERDAAQKIVENNLYGLELDDRAAQLAYFAVMMKARSYDRRFLGRGIRPNLCSIQESNNINPDYLELFGELKETARKLYDEFIDAKEYGSILNLKITAEEIAQLEEKCSEIIDGYYDNIIDTIRQVGLRTDFPALIRQAKIMVQKYSVVCTNPPYMGNGNLNSMLSNYIKKNYIIGRTDLFAVFIKKCLRLVKSQGYVSMITMQAWMFQSSFLDIRQDLINKRLISLIHLGAHAFEEINGEVVQTVSFVFNNHRIEDYISVCSDVSSIEKSQEKETFYLKKESVIKFNDKKFSILPGLQYAYWISDSISNIFINSKELSKIGKARRGLQTGNAPKYIRLWYEVSNEDITFPAQFSSKDNIKWSLENNGGNVRKWYNSIMNIVYWKDNGSSIKNCSSAIIPSEELYFKKCITWNKLSTKGIALKLQQEGIIPGDLSPFFIPDNDEMFSYCFALLNSSVAPYMMRILNPTITTPTGDVAKLPVLINSMFDSQIQELTDNCVQLSLYDDASFETSWEFKRHPLV